MSYTIAISVGLLFVVAIVLGYFAGKVRGIELEKLANADQAKADIEEARARAEIRKDLGLDEDPPF